MNKNPSATAQQNILYLKAIGRQMLTRKALLKACLDRFLLTAHINRSRGPVTSVTSSRSRSFRRSERPQSKERAAACAAASRAASTDAGCAAALPSFLSSFDFPSSLITYFFLPVDLRPLCPLPYCISSPSLSSFCISLLAPLFSESRSP